MLNIFGRELNRKLYFLSRPFRIMERAKQFASYEASGVEVNQTWTQSHMGRGDLDQYQETSPNVAFIDYFKSKGNFVRDTDGHVLLDMCGTETLPLGHNHAALAKVSSNFYSHQHYGRSLTTLSLTFSFKTPI